MSNLGLCNWALNWNGQLSIVNIKLLLVSLMGSHASEVHSATVVQQDVQQLVEVPITQHHCLVQQCRCSDEGGGCCQRDAPDLKIVDQSPNDYLSCIYRDSEMSHNHIIKNVFQNARWLQHKIVQWYYVTQAQYWWMSFVLFHTFFARNVYGEFC